MWNTHVSFYFETEEKWIEFRDKIRNRKEFTRYFLSPQEMLHLNDSNLPHHDGLKNPSDHLIFYSCLYSIFTRAEKTLKQLNEWIKENHYESNYRLRDNWGNKFRMSLDELIELYDNRKKNNCSNN